MDKKNTWGLAAVAAIFGWLLTRKPAASGGGVTPPAPDSDIQVLSVTWI